MCAHKRRKKIANHLYFPFTVVYTLLYPIDVDKVTTRTIPRVLNTRIYMICSSGMRPPLPLTRRPSGRLIELSQENSHSTEHRVLSAPDD